MARWRPRWGLVHSRGAIAGPAAAPAYCVQISATVISWLKFQQPRNHSPHIRGTIAPFNQRGAGGGGGERGCPQRRHGWVSQQSDRHLRELQERGSLSQRTVYGPVWARLHFTSCLGKPPSLSSMCPLLWHANPLLPVSPRVRLCPDPRGLQAGNGGGYKLGGRSISTQCKGSL
jgi:hypothetical protein